MTGVDLIIDDTPEAVILSGFDPIRREVARIALEKLIVDGRIHPARIEEMVEKAQKEVETMIREEGRSSRSGGWRRMDIHPELIKITRKNEVQNKLWSECVEAFYRSGSSVRLTCRRDRTGCPCGKESRTAA